MSGGLGSAERRLLCSLYNDPRMVDAEELALAERLEALGLLWHRDDAWGEEYLVTDAGAIEAELFFGR